MSTTLDLLKQHLHDLQIAKAAVKAVTDPLRAQINAHEETISTARLAQEDLAQQIRDANDAAGLEGINAQIVAVARALGATGLGDV